MNKDTRIWPEKEETGMQEGEKNLTSANMQIYIAIKTHTHTLHSLPLWVFHLHLFDAAQLLWLKKDLDFPSKCIILKSQSIIAFALAVSQK